MATYTVVEQAVQSDGWLAPNGDFYNCGFVGHSKCAEYLIDILYPGLSGYTSRVAHLEKHGWAHISSGMITNYRDELELTQAQQNTLFDMMVLDPTSYLGRNIASWLGCEYDD